MSRKDTESERRYRALFENPFDVIAVLDAVRDADGAIVDWRYCDANINWLRTIGRPRDQLLGRTVAELMPERAAELIPLYTRALAQSRPQQYEERSGETDLLISLFPIGPDSVVTSGVDISARIRVEAEVRRLLEVNRAEREWLSAVLNSVTQEVYFADTQKRYTYANPAALREFGHETVAGVDIEAIVSQLEVLRPDGTAAAVLRSAARARPRRRDRARRGADRSHASHGAAPLSAGELGTRPRRRPARSPARYRWCAM